MNMFPSPSNPGQSQGADLPIQSGEVTPEIPVTPTRDIPPAAGPGTGDHEPDPDIGEDQSQEDTDRDETSHPIPSPRP